MEKRRLIGIIDMLAIVVLEALPIGVNMNFMNGYGDEISYTKSYFSLLPFGYGHVQPLTISLISLLLLILWVCGMVFEARDGYYRFLAFLSGGAVVIWLTQFPMGLGTTVTGAAIALLLAAATALSIYEVKMVRRTYETGNQY